VVAATTDVVAAAQYLVYACILGACLLASSSTLLQHTSTATAASQPC
jgi:hypothetical protein